MNDRPTERVEFIDSDPHAFGRQASVRSPTPAPRGRAAFAVAAAAVAVLVAAVVWWPRSADQPDTSPITAVSTTIASSTTVAVTVSGGRPAPEATTGVDFQLAVQPASVAVGSTVTMQLTGDLSAVSERVAAVAWLDVIAEGGWRTVYWMARPSLFSQEMRVVFEDDDPAPGPDAITFPADESMEFFLDEIAEGRYRMCRYVPLRPDATSNAPASPAYVCAPLVVTAS